MGSILSLDDLSDSDVETLLARAARLRSQGGSPQPLGPGKLVGLIFLESSLRTRVGFGAAAARLGWQTVDVADQRHSETSRTESWTDTLRTVAGYVDVIVTRPGRPLGSEDVRTADPCPLLNAGDAGSEAEHPSQALIDFFALEQLVGPPEELRLAIVGDPRMRVVRSLLALLARRPPACLRLVVDDEHLDQVRFPDGLRSRARACGWDDMDDVDVVYVAGIPHGALPLDRREVLLATASRVERLPPRCILLSPGPVIDEMDEVVKRSKRNLAFEQSDLALYMRMALLEHVAGESQR